MDSPAPLIGGGGKNRKRKSGFFAKAKKFGRQGKLGRGFEVDQDTYSYFLQVLEFCHKNEFENDEDRDTLVDNAMIQTENEEINLSSNQLTSRVVETLVLLTKKPEDLLRFTTIFTPSLRTICTDPYASHVLEKLLEVISEKWIQNKKLTKWFRSTCKFVLNNFEEFVFDNYANHVMRKACQCLSGSVELFSSKVQRNNASNNRISMPSLEKFNKEKVVKVEDSAKVAKSRKKNIRVLKNFASQFFAWPQFFDLFHNETTSGFVQCLILTTKVVDSGAANDGITKVVTAIDGDLNLDSKIHLHTIEVCLSISNENEETFSLIYEKYFKGKLSMLSLHRQGHYSVESLCRFTPTKEIFQEIFTDLENHFSEIYKSGYLSVFSALAEGCKRLGTKQSNFVIKISDLLEVESTEEGQKQSKNNFAEVLWRFGKKPVLDDSGNIVFRTELHGSLVLQHLLEFHKPFKVVSSLLELNASKLSKLAQDPKGSHVIDSFFKSPTVGDKSKENFLNKIKDHLVPMACDKFGARVLDNLWPLSTIKNKALIATALSPRESQLNANSYGKFLSQKCALHLFKRDSKEWNEIIGKGKKKKQDFAELILNEFGGETVATVPSKKKAKLETDC